jgi:paraquat-inducible protein A
MEGNNEKKWTALITLLVSAMFFGLGFMYPLLQTGYGFGPIAIYQEKIYLFSSFSYFFSKGEIFIGLLLLFFTIIFPIIKYLFLVWTILGYGFPRDKTINTILEIINKWSMLDVFVVAILILNLKFSSLIIIPRLGSGTSLFALSVILLMVASYFARKLVIPSTVVNK